MNYLFYILVVFSLFTGCAHKQDSSIAEIQLIFSEQLKQYHDQCTKGSMQSCVEEGNRLYYLKGVEESLKVAGKRCAKGEMIFCHLEAKINYFDGKTEESLKLFQKLCEKKEPYSCNFLGERQNYILRNEKLKNNEYFAKACKLEFLKACVIAYDPKLDNKNKNFNFLKSSILANGNPFLGGVDLVYKMIDVNKETALIALGEFCSAGDKRACFFLSVETSKKKIQVEFLAFSPQMCEQNNQRACQSACRTYYELKNRSSSNYYCRKGCSLGDAFSCRHVGYINLHLKNEQEAEYFFNISCFENDFQGCLGSSYVLETNNKFDAAKKHHRVLCDNDISIGCSRMSYLEGKAGNTEVADKYSLKACDLNSSRGCYAHGIKLHKEGKGQPELYFAKACENRTDYGCSAMCMIEAEKGHLKEAKEYLAKTCLYSETSFCLKYKGKSVKEIDLDIDQLKASCHYDPVKPWWFWGVIVGAGILGGHIQ